MVKLQSINPANNSLVGEVDISTEEDVKQKVFNANSCKESWKELGVKSRIQLLKKLYDNFSKRKEEIVELTTKEMGKQIRESSDDFDSGMEYFKWYLDNGEKYLEREITHEDDKSIHYILYEPIGTTAVITPWNFPFSNFIWGVIPNLVVGNTVVFKHSEECVLSGKLYDNIVESVGLPKGVFSEVYGDGKIGHVLINQDINLIWFTGSTKVGKQLYEIAAKKFIKIVLELGGSAPGIVFDDVDVDKIAESIYSYKFFNCGQICDGLKRLIVHETVAEELITKLKSLIENKKIDNPKEKSTDVGPLVAKRQVDLLKSQVKDAVDNGAEVIVGGNAINDSFHEITLLKNVNQKMRVCQEEVFGPVLPIITFKTEEQAIKLANNTQFGLGAYVFTNDKERISRLISKLESGMININDTNYVIPSNPFGGYKQSGLGREHGKYGLHELSQIKIVARPK